MRQTLPQQVVINKLIQSFQFVFFPCLWTAHKHTWVVLSDQTTVTLPDRRRLKLVSKKWTNLCNSVFWLQHGWRGAGGLGAGLNESSRRVRGSRHFRIYVGDAAAVGSAERRIRVEAVCRLATSGPVECIPAETPFLFGLQRSFLRRRLIGRWIAVVMQQQQRVIFVLSYVIIVCPWCSLNSRRSF